VVCIFQKLVSAQFEVLFLILQKAASKADANRFQDQVACGLGELHLWIMSQLPNLKTTFLFKKTKHHFDGHYQRMKAQCHQHFLSTLSQKIGKEKQTLSQAKLPVSLHHHSEQETFLFLGTTCKCCQHFLSNTPSVEALTRRKLSV
jgi:hypothetical protein